MSSKAENSLSVFLPFYNEEDVIETVIEDTYRFLDGLNHEFELIIVNDGSTDSTESLANDLTEKYAEVKASHHDTNKGYGRALATGFKESQNELVFYTDGDGQFDIKELEELLVHIEDHDLVIGYRKDRKDSFSRIFVSKVFNILTRRLLPIDVLDIDCAFKLIRKDILENIEIEVDRTADAELLAKAALQEARIKQVPVKHFEREEGESEAEGLIGVRFNLIVKTLEELIYIRRNLK